MTETPDWLDALAEWVMNGIEAHSEAMTSLTYRYRQEAESDSWMIILYPSPIEICHESDRVRAAPGFSLDLQSLFAAFDEVTELSWNATGFDSEDHDTSSIIIEGRYQGHDLYLEIRADAPDDEPAAMSLDIQERWPRFFGQLSGEVKLRSVG